MAVTGRRPFSRSEHVTRARAAGERLDEPGHADDRAREPREGISRQMCATDSAELLLKDLADEPGVGVGRLGLRRSLHFASMVLPQSRSATTHGVVFSEVRTRC